MRQRGLVYSAEFRRDAPGGPLVVARASQIEPHSAWLARLEPGVLVLGPGLDSPRIRDEVPPELITSDAALNHPDGFRLIELTLDAWKSGSRENAWTLEPRYLRSSAAEEKRNLPAPGGRGA